MLRPPKGLWKVIQAGAEEVGVAARDASALLLARRILQVLTLPMNPG